MRELANASQSKFTKKPITWWAFAVSFIMPIAPLFYLYNKNAAEISFIYILFACVALGIIVEIAYLLGLVVFRSTISGLSLAIIVTICLVLMKPIHGGMLSLSQKLSIQFRYVALIIGIPSLAILVGILLAVKKLPNATSALLAFFICVLVLINVVTSMRFVLSHKTEYSIKTQYTVDNTTELPNVYFFFMDGAMGLDVFDKYYENGTSEFRFKMTEDGFIVNGAATLDAKHSTSIVMPMIFCPSFYDEFLEQALKDKQDMDRDTFMATYSRELNEAHCNNELILALRSKGYDSYVITGQYRPFLPMHTDRFYLVNHHISDTAGTIFSLTEKDTPYSIEANFNPAETSGMAMLNVMSLIIPDFLAERIAARLTKDEQTEFFESFRSVPSTLSAEEISRLFAGNEIAIQYYNGLAQSLNETIHFAGPKFVLIHNFMLHLPYGIQNADYVRGPWPEGETDLPDFEEHYLYVLNVLEQMTKLVIENDPNAVIVVLGDHGIHGEWYETAIAERFGYRAIEQFQDSVLYGMYIPEGLEIEEKTFALTDPRNITRWLVNHFVGSNYEYLAPAGAQ